MQETVPMCRSNPGQGMLRMCTSSLVMGFGRALRLVSPSIVQVRLT